ncbi:MAG: hypothetical protein Fues2KO_20700 [Fuerstiella sp.]
MAPGVENLDNDGLIPASKLVILPRFGFFPQAEKDRSLSPECSETESSIDKSPAAFKS